MTEEDISILDELGDEPPPQEAKAELAESPLFSALLKDVVGKLWEGDAAMLAFVEIGRAHV